MSVVTVLIQMEPNPNKGLNGCETEEDIVGVIHEKKVLGMHIWRKK